MPRVTPQARPDDLLDDPARRDAYVAGIFDLIAPRYDRFTRWFSYGMDAAWKREISGVIASELRAAEPRTEPVVVDLATGTGDLAFVARRLVPRGIVVGLDVSLPMLANAKRRAAHESTDSAHDRAGLHFAGADMMRLPLRDGSARLVTAGYGVRNAPRLDGALDEIVRVLAPGGALVTLDFFLPANPVWRRLFLGYLAVAGWIYGALWHGRPDAYVYIPRSIRRFGTAAAYERALREHGLRVLEARSRLLGGVMIHVARKPA